MCVEGGVQDNGMRLDEKIRELHRMQDLRSLTKNQVHGLMVDKVSYRSKGRDAREKRMLAQAALLDRPPISRL